MSPDLVKSLKILTQGGLYLKCHFRLIFYQNRRSGAGGDEWLESASISGMLGKDR
jgi:hypothetical protein